LEIEPQTELVEEEVQIVELEVGTEPLVVVPVETIKIVVEETYAWKIAKCFHFIFYHFTRISRMKSKV
jgi:hypothetical protein